MKSTKNILQRIQYREPELNEIIMASVSIGFSKTFSIGLNRKKY